MVLKRELAIKLTLLECKHPIQMKLIKVKKKTNNSYNALQLLVGILTINSESYLLC